MSETELLEVIQSNPSIISRLLNKSGYENDFIKSFSNRSEKFLDCVWAIALDPQSLPFDSPSSLSQRDLLFKICQSSPIEKFKTPLFIEGFLKAVDYNVELEKQNINTQYIVNNKEILVKILSKKNNLSISLIPAKILCSIDVLLALPLSQVLKIYGQPIRPLDEIKNILSLEQQKDLLMKRPDYFTFCSIDVQKDIDCSINYLNLLKTITFNYSGVDMGLVHKEYWQDPDFCVKIAQVCGLEVFIKANKYINPLVWNNKKFALKMASLLDQVDEEEAGDVIALAPQNVKKFFAALNLQPGNMVAVLESCFLKQELALKNQSVAVSKNKI